MICRYEARREANGYWSVVDRTTGRPACVNGTWLEILSRPDAETLAETLNTYEWRAAQTWMH